MYSFRSRGFSEYDSDHRNDIVDSARAEALSGFLSVANKAGPEPFNGFPIDLLELVILEVRKDVVVEIAPVLFCSSLGERLAQLALTANVRACLPYPPAFCKLRELYVGPRRV